jgi:hypothetical protein
VLVFDDQPLERSPALVAVMDEVPCPHLVDRRRRLSHDPVPAHAQAEEIRVLREQLKGRRLRFTDDQRRRLAAKAKTLGRQVLRAPETLVTPDTLLAPDQAYSEGRSGGQRGEPLEKSGVFG